MQAAERYEQLPLLLVLRVHVDEVVCLSVVQQILDDLVQSSVHCIFIARIHGILQSLNHIEHGVEVIIDALLHLAALLDVRQAQLVLVP